MVVNTALSGNQAGPVGSSSGGGAIFTDGGAGGNAFVLLLNTTLSGNSAGQGGAIRNGASGGGATVLRLINCTLSSNSAAGGALMNVGAQMEIGSTLLQRGTAGSNILNFAASITSLGFNLSSDDAGGFLTNSTDQINTDPRLGPFQDNGGPTPTHALLAGSPAVDAGKNLSGVGTDARGLPRTFDDPAIANAPGGDGTDIGAYESPELRVMAIDKLGDDLRLSFASVPGRNYELEARTNLVLGAWDPLPGNLSATGGVTAVTVTNALEQPGQLFRLHQLP